MPRVPVNAFDMERTLKPFATRVLADFAILQEAQATAITAGLVVLRADPERRDLAAIAERTATDLNVRARRASNLRDEFGKAAAIRPESAVVAGTVKQNSEPVKRPRVRLREARGTQAIQVADGTDRGGYAIEIPAEKTRNAAGPISFLVEAVTTNERPIPGSQSAPFDFGKDDNFNWIEITIPGESPTDRPTPERVVEKVPRSPATGRKRKRKAT